MTRKLTWSILAVALLLASQAPAQPLISGVSGDVDHGSRLVIGGGGFGQKSSPTAMKFENFESGALGSNIGSEGYWSLRSDNTGSDTPRYTTEFSRSANSPQTAKFPLKTLHDYAIKSGLDFSSGRIYYDYWVRFSWASSTIRHQIKLARLGSGTSDSYIYPHFVTEHWVGGSGCYSDARKGQACGGGAQTDWDYDCPPNNQWQHVQIAIDYGTPGGNNARYDIWQDGVYKGGDSDLTWYCAGDPVFQQVWIGGYLGNTDADGMTTTIYYDDVYFDDTWARVEIGDADRYADCTHREVQIPQEWGNNTIEVDLNLGSFQAGETAYLYVTDENGQVNSIGYAVTLGHSESMDLPPAVAIDEPTNRGTWTTTASTIEIAGTASDQGSVVEVRWENSQGGSGIAQNVTGNWSSWSVAEVDLVAGANVITITARDDSGQTSTAQITVTYDLGPPGPPGQPTQGS